VSLGYWSLAAGLRGCVYNFGAWRGCLVGDLFPEARRLRVRRRLDENWRRVVARIPKRTDWFLFHVPLTLTHLIPRGRAHLCDELEKRGILVLNARTTDISKRKLQETCGALDLPTVAAPALGDSDELLIVKSNRNFGGIAEQGLTRRQRRALSLPPHEELRFGPDAYRILRRRDVEAALFSDRQVAVERYVQNRDDLILRAYVVGRRLVLSEYRNTNPIKKMASAKHIRNHLLSLSDVPDSASGQGVEERARRQLARFCTAAGFDFGAIDLCVDDSGECYIIDSNSTPYWGVGLRRPSWFEHLRTGLVELRAASPSPGSRCSGPGERGGSGGWRPFRGGQP
jgi:hypothetical protein